MKKFFAIGFALLLLGCASAKSPEVTVFNIRAGYTALLTAAVQYESLPRCIEGAENVLCSDPSAVEEIRKADMAAKATLDSAEALVRSHDGEGVSVDFAVDAARAAVDAFEAVLLIYKVEV